MITDEQRDRFIVEKLNQGMPLGDVQKLLADEYGITMTFFDLKLLVADLEEVDWASQDAARAAGKEAAEADVAGGAEVAEETPQGTTVTVNKINRPDVMMSGQVSFASGAKGNWAIDNLGRPTLGLAEGSSQPTEEDVMEFQQELQRVLRGSA